MQSSLGSCGMQCPNSRLATEPKLGCTSPIPNVLLIASTHGPLIHGKAVQKVADHVQDAVAKGAKILIGGKAGIGNFYEPTVLIDVPVSAEVSRDETFGPLAPCYMFDTEDEVLRLANDTEFGLAGYFYSRDSKIRLTTRADDSRANLASRRGFVVRNDWGQHWHHEPGFHSLRRHQGIVSTVSLSPSRSDPV
jgi:acyl-CoA reductase-like NAD-dependent aldehyde dehydrogenase